jgi:aldose sugar dehydrogenase
MTIGNKSFTTVVTTAGFLLFAIACDDRVIVPGGGQNSITDYSVSDQAARPKMVDPDLKVRTVIRTLVTPISLAFLGTNDFLILEKNTGQIKRVINDQLEGIALDLAVNFFSERGLLGIALHPDFPGNPGIYLYWTESTTGADSGVPEDTPLLGNRVDRFIWNGSTLTFDRNLIHLRAIQQDAGQPPRGNHDGGVIRFGPDGKLYIFIGDAGRRGQLQNLACGPTLDCPGSTVPDDQFGGPAPDDAHLTGVVLRLNEDGTAPGDNPFYAAGGSIGGEVGANLQKIFSFGHRNSFGMAFDPFAGNLWLHENGDDSFSELNTIMPGMNGGWIQFMGPASRIGEFRAIETSAEFLGLQQLRWPATNIASTPADGLARLFVLPGSQYSDPVFSWKYEVSPGGIAFINGSSLGASLNGDLIIGNARASLKGGHLFKFDLSANRQSVAVSDSRLNDLVADNLGKFDITESESLLFGTNFGVTPDIQYGPDGNLYVVSITNSCVYQIFHK